MDKKKSDLLFDVIDTSPKSVAIVSTPESNITQDEISPLQSNQQEKNGSKQILFTEENTDCTESKSVLLTERKTNNRTRSIASEYIKDKKMYEPENGDTVTLKSIKSNIPSMLKTSISLNDITEEKYDTHRLSFSDINLSIKKDIKKAPETSILLPTMSMSSSYELSDVVSNKTIKITGYLNPDADHGYKDIHFDKLDVMPNVTYPCPETRENNTNQIETIDNNRTECNNYERENNTRQSLSVPASPDCVNTEKNSNDTVANTKQHCIASTDAKQPATTGNMKTINNPIAKPTLTDDSRLVKLSLPTNPINIIQSNSQFLNKSRNFLNFITEKSTNIMEKTLLPQNLTARYNTTLRPMETNYNIEKRYSDEIPNSVTSTNSLATKPGMSLGLNYKNSPADSDNITCSVLGINETDNSRYTSCLKNEQTVKEYNKNNVSTESKENEQHSSLTNGVSNWLSPNSESNCTDVKNTCKSSYFSNVDSDTKEHLSTSKEFINLESRGNNAMHKIPFNDKLENRRRSTEELINITFDNVDSDMLQQPAYINLIKNYTDLKMKYLKLMEQVQTLEVSNSILEKQKNSETNNMQIEALEKTVDRLTYELRLALATQESLKKEYAAANKERESMVMKYAVSEKQLIDSQRARDYAERKIKEIVKDHEMMQNKLQQAQGERTRICNILDKKCREVSDLQKEVERLKEEVNIKDVKLKWSQNKLKIEMDMQKETQQKLDKALIRINDMKEECEQVRRETQESIRKFQQSEENKAVTLDQQLKEQQARLILERHVTEDKEMLRLQLQKEVEVLKNRQQMLIEENNTFSLKIQDAEKKRLQYESNLSNLKILADQRQKEIVDLTAKVSELETTKLQLHHKEQRLATAEAEIEDLRLANEELQSDMSACRQREAEMLDFTQKLTEKNVRLQSEFTAIEARTKELQKEQGPLRERINELNAKVKTLENSLAAEQKKRNEECELLAKHIAEQTQLAQNLAQKLEDSQGENAVLKRKQQISMKEMTRELQQCRKKLEAYETASPSNSLDITSRTGSNTSLNTGDTMNGALSDHSANGDHSINSVEPSRQVLIDRIIKLQKANARHLEKLDFLEEHTRTLVEELQKKTKIIQNYILNENVGAMGSNERDRHKAELARHGGIMASVYNQRISDDNITLELSLEMNHRLQAVLEDALLKNITLKDNIDTLGEEIARLTIKNQQKQITS